MAAFVEERVDKREESAPDSQLEHFRDLRIAFATLCDAGLTLLGFAHG